MNGFNSKMNLQEIQKHLHDYAKNNHLPQAQQILSSNPLGFILGVIQQYSLCNQRIIVKESFCKSTLCYFSNGTLYFHIALWNVSSMKPWGWCHFHVIIIIIKVIRVIQAHHTTNTDHIIITIAKIKVKKKKEQL